MTRAPYSIRRCAHYSTSSLPCRAGLSPASLTDNEGRMPCLVIRGLTGTNPCAQLALEPLPSESETGRMSAELVALMSDLCPTCGVGIAGRMEFNESLLAMPCRHVIRSPRGR